MRINGNGHTIITKAAIQLKADTIITGKLNIGSEELANSDRATMAILVSNGCNINIEDADLHIYARTCGLLGDDSNCMLTINNSNLSVDSTRGIIGFSGGITLDECMIRVPKNIQLVAGATAIDASKINITPIEYYPLYVAGVQVSELNRSDLIDNDTYYEAENKILHLDNDITLNNNWCIDNQGVDGLVISLESSSDLNSLTGCIRIADGLETTIEGG